MGRRATTWTVAPASWTARRTRSRSDRHRRRMTCLPGSTKIMMLAGMRDESTRQSPVRLRRAA